MTCLRGQVCVEDDCGRQKDLETVNMTSGSNKLKGVEMFNYHLDHDLMSTLPYYIQVAFGLTSSY